VSATGLTEDVVVFIKLAVLGGIAAIGIGMFAPSRLSPLDNQGLLGVFLGAAVIFVAYEGFELVPYDYEDIEEPRRTVPRALYLSVAVVALVYVAVTLGSQMLLGDRAIVATGSNLGCATGRGAGGAIRRPCAGFIVSGEMVGEA
jgi:amino acid transporter